MEINGTIDSKAFEIKKFFLSSGAVVQRDAIIFRQGFEYSESEWLEIEGLSEESRISRKYQTRLGLERCLKRKQRELMKGNRVYTYWWAGFSGHMIHGHLWIHKSAHQPSMARLRSFFVSCINTANFIMVQSKLKHFSAHANTYRAFTH
ncbi:hypothetical protein FGIG_07406 [Fasciola gigantica]|uniref:Uncharacterized protein n=1 Tax=Fasciola gigantica TaxID=46835 RepID=A0A504YTQ6_FASGI|nr:hypothetical protein FGIG_07406 [Fasciola gigantica]